MAEKKDSRLVYSTDPEANRRCDQCRELLSECTCKSEGKTQRYQFIAVLRIEKKGRGGEDRHGH